MVSLFRRMWKNSCRAGGRSKNGPGSKDPGPLYENPGGAGVFPALCIGGIEGEEEEQEEKGDDNNRNNENEDPPKIEVLAAH